MQLPNLLEHETLAEVVHHSQDWLSLLNLNCNPHTQVDNEDTIECEYDIDSIDLSSSSVLYSLQYVFLRWPNPFSPVDHSVN